MSVDFANGSRATLGDPGGESRRVATSSCRLLVRAFALGNASLVPRFRQLFGYGRPVSRGQPGPPECHGPARAVFCVTLR